MNAMKRDTLWHVYRRVNNAGDVGKQSKLKQTNISRNNDK